MNGTRSSRSWWARGLLFENCNCTVVCPGHVHFDQRCTFERCAGYWAIAVREGEFGGIALGGVRAVIAYDSPQRMIDGDWTEAMIIDPRASAAQRGAIEEILSGRAGGPWAVLARFVGRRLDTRFLPIVIEDEGRKKQVRIEGILEGALEAIRGRDRERPVTFENMFNQIHAPTQVVAAGHTDYDDGTISIHNQRSHALYSDFDWAVSAASESA